MKQTLVLVLCAWLAACGGEKGDAAEAPAKPAEQPAASGTTIDKAVDEVAAAEAARAEAAKAEQLASEAMKEAATAMDKVMQLEKTAVDLVAKINGAITAVEGAPSEADRAAAKAKLIALQAEHTAMQAAIAAAKAAAARAERLKGVKITPECLENPLAKGCS